MSVISDEALAARVRRSWWVTPSDLATHIRAVYRVEARPKVRLAGEPPVLHSYYVRANSRWDANALARDFALRIEGRAIVIHFTERVSPDA